MHPFQMCLYHMVKAMNLQAHDKIAYACALSNQNNLVFVCESGLMKRIKTSEITSFNRPAKGELIAKKVKSMPTDTQRVRRTDPGDPARCPVWQLHQVYTDEATRATLEQGCKTAGIGCIECKQPVIAGILKEQAPMRERAQIYLDDPQLVRDIIADGNAKARKLARETMRDVRQAMGLNYG